MGSIKREEIANKLLQNGFKETTPDDWKQSIDVTANELMKLPDDVTYKRSFKRGQRYVMFDYDSMSVSNYQDRYETALFPDRFVFAIVNFSTLALSKEIYYIENKEGAYGED